MIKSEYYADASFRAVNKKTANSSGISAFMLLSIVAAVAFRLLFTTPALSHNLPYVLIIDSYHHGYGWSDKEITGFTARMSEVYPLFEPSVEHLDAKRHPGEENDVRMKNFLKEKYSGKKIDLIVAFDNPALELLIRFRDELFSGIPIVFGGINDFSPDFLQGRSDVTGVAEDMDDETTLRTALKLHPNTKEVLVLHDYTGSGLAVRKEFEKIAPKFSDQVHFRFLPPTTHDEAVQEVRSLPPDSLGVILTYTTDRLGHTMSLAESTRLLTSSSPVPIYAMHETRLGYGIVGGSLIGGIEHGRRVANIALRILSGEKPESIPVEMSGSSKPMFDYAQMERFGIPSSALPADSIVVNKPDSFFERYRTLTISTIVVATVLLLLVIGSAFSLYRLRKSQADLLKSEEKYKRFVETANEGIWAMDGEHRTTFVNRRMAEMMGYSVEEMIGRPVDAFLFEDDLSNHKTNMELRRQGENQAYERSFRRKDGSVLRTIVSATALKDQKGNFAGSFAMFTDISKRRSIEKKLIESEERYRTLFSTMSMGVVYQDPEGRILSANPAAERILGRDVQEMQGATSHDHHWQAVRQDGTDFPGDEHPAMQALRGGKELSGVLMGVFNPKNDDYVWLSVSAVPLFLPGEDSPYQVYTVFEDVTDLKNAEQTLRKNEEFLRQTEQIAGVGGWMANPKTNALYWTNGVRRIIEVPLDYQPDLEEGLKFYKHQYVSDIKSMLNHVMEHGSGGKLEVEIVTNGGKHLWVELRFLSKVDESMESYVLGTIQDITEKKAAEFLLLEKEKQYRLLTENTLDVIWQVDLDLRFTYVNRAIIRMTGYSPDEWVGTKLSDHCDEENFSKMAQAASNGIAEKTKESGFTVEAVMLKKNKQPFFVEVHARVLFDESGSPLGLQGVTRDITDRRKAEESLRDSEERYRKLVELSSDAIIIHQDGKIVFINRSGSQMFGAKSPNEIVEKSIQEFLHPDNWKIVEDRIRRLFRGERGLFPAENRYVRLDGSDFLAEITASPLTYRNKPAVQVVARDITERKKAEEALRESEQRYDAFLNSTTDMAFLKDSTFRYVMVNDANQEFFCRQRIEIIGKTDFELMNAECAEQCRLSDMAALRSRDMVVTEEKQGDKIFETRKFPVTLQNGEIGIGGFIRDVTQLRMVEQALKAGEERYRTVADFNYDWEYWVDANGKFIYVSPSCERITGYSAQEFIDDPEFLERIIHPDDRQYALEHFCLARKSEYDKPHEMDFRIIRRDGEISWIGHVCQPVYRQDGRPLGRRASNRDITDGKKTEQALAASELLYRNLFEGARDAIMLIDMEGDNIGRIVSANPIAAKIHGYSMEEFLTLSLKDLEAHDSVKGLPERVKTALSGQLVKSELNHRRKDESVFPVDVSANLFEINGHKYCIAIDRDISERKLAQDALRESESRVRAKLESILSPEGDIGDLEVADVLDIGEIQTLMDNFYGITNIPQAIVDNSGKILVAAGRQDICTKFHRVHPETRMQCVDSDTRLADGIMEGAFKLYRCRNNMWDMATPIIIGGKHLGNLFLGQFLFDDETPDYEVFRSQALIYGFNEQDYLAALEKVPRCSRTLVQNIMVFYAQLATLLSTLSYSNIKLARSLAEQERLYSSLRESEERYKAVVDNLQVGISVVNRNMEVMAVNPFFGQYYPNLRPGTGQLCYEVYNDPPRSKACDYCPVIRTFEDGGVHESETDTPSGGGIRNYRIVSCPVKNEQGEVELVIELVDDVTERKSLYAQLIQAQKMEAIGTLAGGVAHDFNNILQVVLGYSDMLLDDEELPQRCRGDIQKIHQSAYHGADLVQRLLTFSRKTEINPRSLDLNLRITELQKMLERTINKMVDIRLVLDPKLSKIYADMTQIDQVLMNLAVNARDAMPDGGKLIFETSNVSIDAEYVQAHLDAKPGAHVLLSVTDTGIGIDKDTLEHIFDPFYTTKEVGQGTGLGLAMVHGIVKHHGGHIRCYSEPGHGTTFKIYFPALVSEEDEERTIVQPIPQGGSETILLVDDEEFIRNLGFRILTKAGYNVITALNGEEALKIYELRRDEIALVLLDLVMPKMGGKQCLEGLLSINPSVKVIITSGFSAAGPTRDALSAGAKAFVNKPYDVRQVRQRVREVLDTE